MIRLAIVAALVLSSCVAESQPNRTFTISVGSPTPSPTPSAAPTASAAASQVAPAVTLKEFPVPAGSGPHDVAPAADGGVWFTAQRSGQLGWLDPKTGQTKMIALGAGSAPHGVILGPDGAPWVTDGGLNAIVRVEPTNGQTTRFVLDGPKVDLNTAAFDKETTLWFTGQNGVYGRFGQQQGVRTFSAPRGPGPYGITSAPDGSVFFASLAGSYVGRIDPRTSEATVIEPPTKGQGARRVWSDSKGIVWVSEWNAGQLGRYDAKTGAWKEWKLPGSRPQAYAVFVDDRDVVWLSDFGASAIVRFDPATERFDSFRYPKDGNVRQLSGRPGEVWGALSALDRLIVLTTR